MAAIEQWRGRRRDGARDRNRTYKDRSPVDFESTASASSATRARRKSYHKSVLIEGSVTSSSWARMVFWNIPTQVFPIHRQGLEVTRGRFRRERDLRDGEKQQHQDHRFKLRTWCTRLVEDHRLFFNKRRHATAVLGAAVAIPRALHAIAQHKAQAAARQS